MGKTAKWFKSFLPGRKEKGGRQVSILLDESRTAPIPSPVPKEKKRWSFKRSAGGGKELTTRDSTSSGPIRQESEAEVDQKQHAIALAAATDAAMAAAQATAVVIRLSTTSQSRSSAIEESAATKIQAVFRSYLARKALRALKGLVKLQALVKGYLVRKQATATLRCMQALVTVQARARAQRIHMVEDSRVIPQQQSTHRGSPSPQDPRHRRAYEMERNMEEDVKIVEMDIGESKGSSRSRNNYSITNSEKIDPRFSSYYCGSCVSSKSDYYQQVSPAPSALTDMSPSVCGSHFEEFSFNTVQSSPQCYSATCKPYSMGECFISQQEDTYSISNDHPLCPSYMANTESSRAKVRSQSAPKQRPDTCERQPSWRRPSMEGRNIPRVRMQRSSSQVGSSHNGYHYPWSIKLDKSNMSLKGSECGSTSTALTNTSYRRSIAAYEVNHDRTADIRAYYGMPLRGSN